MLQNKTQELRKIEQPELSAPQKVHVNVVKTVLCELSITQAPATTCCSSFPNTLVSSMRASISMIPRKPYTSEATISRGEIQGIEHPKMTLE